MLFSCYQFSTNLQRVAGFQCQSHYGLPINTSGERKELPYPWMRGGGERADSRPQVLLWIMRLRPSFPGSVKWWGCAYCLPDRQGVVLGWEEEKAPLGTNWCLSSWTVSFFTIWAESCWWGSKWIQFSSTSYYGDPHITFTVQLPKHVFEIIVSLLGDRTNCSL